MTDLRSDIAKALGIVINKDFPHIEYEVCDVAEEDGYIRQTIRYASCGDEVIAFLLLPRTLSKNPAVLINHQHNGERHFGKSEVCGLCGNPLQAFGPELVKKGFVDSKRVGTIGHSYGGNTVLFLSAIDERVEFSCASGSACSYENRMINNTGIEMASVIPSFNIKYDIYDLVKCVAPRKLLIVSAEEDKYSRDAAKTVEKAQPSYAARGASKNLQHKSYPGGHPLTQERFDHIINWVCTNA